MEHHLPAYLDKRHVVTRRRNTGVFMQVLVLKFIKDYTLDTYEIGCLELHHKVTTFGLISTWFFVVVTRQKERGFTGAGRANHQHVVIPRLRHIRILFGS